MPNSNTMHRFDATVGTTGCREEYSCCVGLKSVSGRFVSCSFTDEGGCIQPLTISLQTKYHYIRYSTFQTLLHYPLLCCLSLCSVCSRDPKTQLLFVISGTSCLPLLHATVFVADNKQLSKPKSRIASCLK